MLSLLLPLFLTGTSATAAVLSDRQTLSGGTICDQIADAVAGKVYYPLDPSPHFSSDIKHWMNSSSQTPQCVVEVLGNDDVSNVLKIVGSTRTPFAVASGGHASNPGFSSTTGVHISLAQLKQINLSEDKKTVEIGLGNVWTEVYAVLNGTGVNVVGGRTMGPGTGGFTLGGGFSWLTDQYGLTCDNVASFNLVLPDGTPTVVDEFTPDLFFALKGGLNRFGVVTSIVYKTVPQPNLVYGGFQDFDSSKVPDLIAATIAFQKNNTDPKAQIIMTVYTGQLSGALLLLFYDGPERPAAFDPFNNISPTLDAAAVQTFSSFVQSIPEAIEGGNRGAFASLSTRNLTPKFLQAIANESSYWGGFATLHSGIFLSYDIEPFLKYGKHATDSAFPHANSPLPLNLYFSWSLEADDVFWRAAMQQSVDTLTEVAKLEGIYDPEMYVYPNYALDTLTGPQVYGPTNDARLRSIQEKYDPDRVMLLAGGFSL